MAVPLPSGTPGGGGPELRRQLGILKEFIEGFDFVRMVPADAVALSRQTVRVLAESGNAYALYVNGGTQTELGLELPAGVYQAEWVNTKTGAIDKAETFNHAGGPKTLRSPSYSEDIALRVIRRKTGP